MMPPGVPRCCLRTIAHNPRVLAKIRAGNLLDRGSLERRHREIVILRTTARCGCEYEWGVHVSFFAARVGLGERRCPLPSTAARPSGVVRGRAHADPARRRAGTTCADLRRALVRSARPLRDDQLVELVVLAGFYHTISFVVNGLGVELEAEVARFPKNGGLRPSG
jgi:alkylhydroperoxidase family enzyme